MVQYTEGERLAAMDAAHDYATRVLTRDYPASSIEEIAGIAAAYTLLNWRDWAEDVRRQKSIRRAETALCDRDSGDSRSWNRSRPGDRQAIRPGAQHPR